VSFNLIQGKSFRRIENEHVLHQILEFLRWFFRKLTPESIGLLPQQMVELAGWEWILTHVHHEETNTK